MFILFFRHRGIYNICNLHLVSSLGGFLPRICFSFPYAVNLFLGIVISNGSFVFMVQEEGIVLMRYVLLCSALRFTAASSVRGVYQFDNLYI